MLPKKADSLIIYLVRLCIPQEILKWPHTSANIYSTILFLTTVMKICVVSDYVPERNCWTVPFLSAGESEPFLVIFLLFGENS